MFQKFRAKLSNLDKLEKRLYTIWLVVNKKLNHIIKDKEFIAIQYSSVMKRILVSGGCGFIGHHFIEHILNNTDWNIIVIDKLSYSSFGFERLIDIGALQNPRVKILTYDLSYKMSKGMIKEIGNINFVVHMAAETHVDNSIVDPTYTVMNNVSSTLNLLEISRKIRNLEKFFYFKQ